MRHALALAALLASTHAMAECRPASAEALAEAERRAADAGQKADQAQSVAVRSGNPGAARRADLARQAADEARRAADELACKAAAPRTPAAPRLGGY
jgi:hypothetical protein